MSGLGLLLGFGLLPLDSGLASLRWWRRVGPGPAAGVSAVASAARLRATLTRPTTGLALPAAGSTAFGSAAISSTISAISAAAPRFPTRRALPLSAFRRGHERNRQERDYGCDGEGLGTHNLLSSNTVASPPAEISAQTGGSHHAPAAGVLFLADQEDTLKVSRPVSVESRAPSSESIYWQVMHATTILALRHKDQTVLASDGQVTLGATVVKQSARKIRRLYNEAILAGFAGSAADSFALFSRFESKLEQYRGNLERAAVELARDWRTDRYLRRLEAMLIVADRKSTFLLSGTGDLIEPDDGVVAVGSGGAYAMAAARALVRHSPLTARQIAEESMRIAADICIYTNPNLTIEEL